MEVIFISQAHKLTCLISSILEKVNRDDAGKGKFQSDGSSVWKKLLIFLIQWMIDFQVFPELIFYLKVAKDLPSNDEIFLNLS